MNIDIESDGAIQHFHIKGKLDQFESALLRQRLYQSLEADNKNIICDMGGVELINSLGMGTIAPAISALERKGGKVLFYNFKSPAFKAAFEKSKVFQTFNTYDEAANYVIGMGEPLNVVIVEETRDISNFFQDEYLTSKRKPTDYLYQTYSDTRAAWERIKQLFQYKKRMVVIIDSAMGSSADFTNKVKGFPIEDIHVPVILVVGSKPSFETERALDIADAYVQLPLNGLLFQKTFDSVVSTL